MEAVELKYIKYEAYKDSGEYWMGEIPSDWELKRLKHLFYEKKITHNPELNCGSISFGKVVYKDDDKIPYSTKASYQEVLDGEYLINPLNLNYDLISLRIALSDKDVVVSSGYIVLKNKEQIDKNYYKWLLHRYDVAYMKLLGSGVRQTINFNHIANSVLAFPPLPEQTAIANFLDNKTTKIDTAIAQKVQLIELLKERKQIIIQNAVTKGLDENGKIRQKPKCQPAEGLPEGWKDSGVEWIGEIPEGWSFKALKFILEERNERSIDGSEPILMMSQVHGLVVRSEYHEKAEVAQSVVGNKIVYTNDLVFNKLKAHLGVFFKSNIPFKGIVSPDYAVYYSNGIISDLKYLEVLFRNPAYISQFICKATGIVEGLIRLYTDDLFSLKVPVPPKSEQKSILEFIETQSTKIDKAIALQQTQIEKLKEYKATLIDSAVTGKIKVS